MVTRTGARHRLDRDLTGRFGSEKYATEEIVAELTAGFVLADLGDARLKGMLDEGGDELVAHLAPLGGHGAARLPDPDPNRPDRPAGATWWPPVMLDPEWARTADFDVFHPDRMASRILDMGDMLTLIEQAEKAFDSEQSMKAAEKLAT